MTVWQMHNLFSVQKSVFDSEKAFWNAARRKGESEFSIWQRWNEEVRPKLKRG